MRAKTTKHKPDKPVASEPAASDDTGRSLLAQVIDAPDDELVHQIYADWLEERGHPFAQVIRHQLAGDTKAANALIGRHRKTWIEPIAKWFDDPYFERGMLTRLYGRANEFAGKQAQAALLGPASTFGIRRLLLRGPCKKLGAAEVLAWTPELTWKDCQLDDEQLAVLAPSPHLRRLSSLVFEKIRCTNEGLIALSRSKSLQRLRHFGLTAPVHLGQFDADAVVSIVTALPITSLTLTGGHTLNLANVVSNKVVSKLSRLSVATSGHVRAIASSPHLTSLTTLRISSIEHVVDAAVQPLLDNPALSKLTSVHLQFWSGFSKKPSADMIAKLGARFGPGFTYKADGIPSDL